MQCLKYGLSDRTAIFIYELGFNDRYLAQEIAKMIGTSSKKSDAREMIKKQKNKIKVLLNEYPSVYIDRIENLQLDIFLIMRYTQYVHWQHNGNKKSDTPNLTDN